MALQTTYILTEKEIHVREIKIVRPRGEKKKKRVMKEHKMEKSFVLMENG